jgi:hypothetical protein
MKGITFQQKALDRWARSLHVSSVMDKCLLELKDSNTNQDVTTHKEESKARMKSDGTDRDKIKKFLLTSIGPFEHEDHPSEIVNIHSGKLSSKEINVDVSVPIGKKQVEKFISELPDAFYKPLSNQVKTMKKLLKSIRVDDVEIIDTSLIYSRVIALQLTNDALKVENIFRYELSPIPTSIFTDTGDLRPAKSKAELNKIGSKIPLRSMASPNLIIIDGCAILWAVNWPTNGLVSDFIENVCDYIFRRLKICDTAVVFDRYYQILNHQQEQTGEDRVQGKTFLQYRLPFLRRLLHFLILLIKFS